MYICIDFDGTCVTHDYPNIGKDIGSVRILKKLVNQGHKLILFTMRCDEPLAEAEKWFVDNEIELYGVQFNPTQSKWTKSNKAYGQLYIDDAALGCPLKVNKEISDRPFVDWERVSRLLKKQGVF